MPFTIKETVVINEGINWYGDNVTTATLVDVVALGNDSDNKVGCRWGHPNGDIDSSPPKIVGEYCNFKIKNTGGKNSAVADLLVFEEAKDFTIDSGGTTIYNYLKKNSKKHPEFFGNSIVFEPTEKCNREKELRIKALSFVDLVSEPAATNSLFRSKDEPNRLLNFNNNIDNMSLKNLFSRVSKLEKEAGVTKTAKLSISYTTDKDVKLTINRERRLDISSALPDGTVVDIIGDSTTIPIEGDIALVDGSPAPEGEHILSSLGYVILVDANGEITEVREVEAQEDSPAQEPDGLAKDGETVPEVDVNSRITELEEIVCKLAKVAEQSQINSKQFSRIPARSLNSVETEKKATNWIDQAFIDIRENYNKKNNK